MNKRRVHLEQLLGRKVQDSAGKSVGPIEEVIARRENERCMVESFVVGRPGMLERLSISGISLMFLGLLGARGAGGDRRVPWELMDLSDPKRPRLRCTGAELDALNKSAH